MRGVQVDTTHLPGAVVLSPETDRGPHGSRQCTISFPSSAQRPGPLAGLTNGARPLAGGPDRRQSSTAEDALSYGLECQSEGGMFIGHNVPPMSGSAPTGGFVAHGAWRLCIR